MPSPQAEPGVVYAKSTLAIRTDDIPIYLHRGEAWDAEADIVKLRPDLFTADRLTIHDDRGVERATRAPGEKRSR
jgi:hypothetical protein